MAAQWKQRAEGEGPDRQSACSGSGQWTVWEGYAALKAVQGRLPLQQSSTPMRAIAWRSAAVGFMRSFGMDEPMGCYDDIEAADAFVLWGSNMAEMHPVLWTRVDRPAPVLPACQGRASCRPSSIAASTWPISRSSSRRRPILRSPTSSPGTSSRPIASTRPSCATSTLSPARQHRYRLRAARPNIR